MEALNKAIWFAGGVRALGRALGIDHSNISHWKRAQKVPPVQAIQIEKLTNGRIRAVQFYEGNND